VCLQDLALNRSLVWRPVANLETTVGGRTRIPPSAARVAICVSSTGGNADQPIRMNVEASGPIVNLVYGTNGGFPYYRSILTLTDLPGLGVTDLYCDVAPASITVLECIQASPLDDAVTQTAVGMKLQRV